MRRIVWGTTALVWASMLVPADASISTAETSRLQDAANVVRELRNMPDRGLPGDLWNRSECVVVLPKMKKAAFGIGTEYGRGVMSCRQGGMWSAPLFMTLAKGSWAPQLGAEAVDVVLLVMNQRGAEKLLRSNLSLGIDVSVAAGPIGREGTASTDAQFSAEVLSYSKAAGVFAGMDLSGGVLRPDDEANTDAYGPNHVARDIATRRMAVAPAAADDFIRALAAEPPPQTPPGLDP